MPISIPTMILCNQVRLPMTSFQKAKNLSNVWWFRFYTYIGFGSLITLGNMPNNTFLNENLNIDRFEEACQSIYSNI